MLSLWRFEMVSVEMIYRLIVGGAAMLLCLITAWSMVSRICCFLLKWLCLEVVDESVFRGSPL